jgi:predicted GNAT family acetyltransferase
MGVRDLSDDNSTMTDAPSVSRNESAHQFEIRSDAGTALLRYSQHGDTVDLVHTEVPKALEGHGYGGALAKAALEYARANNLKVIPTCPFVRKYMERHPEYADLRAAR